MTAGIAFGKHAQHGVVLIALQLGVGGGAPHQVEQGILAPLGARNLCDDLLGQHVERRARYLQRVELAAPHAIEQGGAFDQVVTRVGE